MRAAAIATVLALALSPSLAQDAARPPLAGRQAPVLHTDADGSHLFVLDPGKRKLLVYGVAENGIRLIAVRDLDQDLAADPAAPAAKTTPVKPPELPKQDAPGEDLPSVARPAGSVRIRFATDDSDRQESRSAAYLSSLALPEVYAGLRRSLLDQGWKVLKEQVNMHPSGGGNGSMEFGRGAERLDVTLRPGPIRDTVQVDLGWSRPRS